MALSVEAVLRKERELAIINIASRRDLIAQLNRDLDKQKNMLNDEIQTLANMEKALKEMGVKL